MENRSSLFATIGALLADKLKARRQRTTRMQSGRYFKSRKCEAERAARRELVKTMGRRQAIKFIKASRRAGKEQVGA